MPWSKPGGDQPPKPEGNDPSDGKRGARDEGRSPWGSGGGPGGGSNGGNPWGAPGGGKPSGGPDLEALVRGAQERLRNLTGGDFSPRILALIVAAVGALWLASGFYTVDPNQVGLNLVFGRYVGKTMPGLNYNWPEPLGSVIKLNVTDRNSIDIGALGRADQPGAVELPEESLMLTGDENIVDLKFRVIWQIDPAHPEYFAFNIKNQIETIKAVSESVMRDIVGRTQIQPLLTVARKVIEPEAQKAIQKVLDSYRAGVEVIQVQLLSVDPPPTVIAAFRDVTAAQQDRSRFVNEAQAEANSIVPNARGQSARILNAAEAYRTQTVAEARGQTARYLKVFGAYQKAPAVTRERLYLETMERVLGAGDKVILDRASGTTPILPLAPLDLGAKSETGGKP
ncbi:FtsH protease activity modulator HflK [Rhodoblastus acidophilus]|uniref:Protein HflK n=1 Tax=Candidatus Rhodoblastus alkanivorans TaxID=2954117 RepID=A0ABS9Z878_9HYPH|nr:FtsH protease activity modulator HflK [Candidatus Rhodoblastus alkanivorans]MCI4677995.1 FtsH protease activity modulator HflK [Candidatus Rhodoblastus alkanivorans]MCI4683890.1 FtsH protease activity modulator HflK [Candidatus Rhodoblastus alkanivorans]MDI4641208.1 FtsH protease activity modulator HflK [Rhodoblastus acidophilus]